MKNQFLDSKISEFARLNPLKTAVRAENRSVSYMELEKDSNRIANFFYGKVTANARVVLILDRSAELIVSIIGLLKCGLIFVPINPLFPAARVKRMIDETRVKWVITSVEYYERYKDIFNVGGTGTKAAKGDALKALLIDGNADDIHSRADVFCLHHGLESSHLVFKRKYNEHCYIYFTSGSTGIPKGVLGRQRSLVHFIEWEIKEFGVDQHFNVSQLTPPSFDPFLRDIFLPLMAGGTSCIPSFDTLTDMKKLIRWIDENKITLIHIVPALFKNLTSMIEDADCFCNVKYILVAGELLRGLDIHKFIEIFKDRIQLVNLYGPTETTLAKLFYRIKTADTNRSIIPVGKPIEGARVLILDRRGRKCRPGKKGEIYIRTIFGSSGYVNDPDLDEKVFIKDPGGEHPDDIIYKTGDSGRLLPDGDIEVSGRIDTQVKIRGVRVELGEVENVLLKHDNVKEAVVIAKEDRRGDTYLCAYIIVAQSPERPGLAAKSIPRELREFLSRFLPDNMIPSHFVFLEKIPLTTNGKLDRRALPLPEIQTMESYSAPRSQVEEKLEAVWSEVLSLEKEKIGIDANFFELGGHSLKAIRLVSLVHKEFNARLSLREIFNTPTIRALAKYIDQAEEDKYGSIELAEEKEYYELSSAQKRLYILDQQGSKNTAYNMARAVKIEGNLDIARLEDTIRVLLKRHESLRASFGIYKGQAVQRILDHETVDFSVVYHENNQSPLTDFIRPFELSHPPLLRVGLIKISKQTHILLFDMHHIISDGVSMGILVDDFIRVYTGRRLPQLRIQYKDFVVWQKRFFESSFFLRQKKFWLVNLKGELPRLQMPLDFVRSTRQTFEGNRITFTLPAEITAKLDALARRKNITLNILFLSVYFLLLYKYTGQEDLIVGSLVSGRNHVDLGSIIGMFANFLPIRCKIDPGSTISEFLDSAGRTILEAYENQDYPFEQMLELVNVPVDLSRNPLFDTMLIFHNESDPANYQEMEDLIFSDYPLPHRTSKLDFKMDVCFGEKGELNCILEYNTGLLKEETIRDFGRHFQELTVEVTARSAAAAGKPGQTSLLSLENLSEKTGLSLISSIEDPHRPLSAIEILTGEEKSRLSEKRKRNIPRKNKALHLVISATFTSEPVRDYIKWWGRHFDLDIDVIFAPYNQVFQELLNEESLVSSNEDGGVNLLLVRFEDWIRDSLLADKKKCEELENHFENLVNILIEKQKKVTYFVGLFPAAAPLSNSPVLADCLGNIYKKWEKELEEVSNVYPIDFTRLKDLYAIDEMFDPLTDKEGHIPFSSEFIAAMGTEIARKVCALKNEKPFKVVVLDCDNTLWEGICGEDGPLGVNVAPPYWHLQEFMLQRHDEGFLLALCSKNNEVDVWEVFDKNPGMLLKREHFVSMKINWRAKSENIKELAEELNLGMDSFIFLDDNPLECSEVMNHCPELLTLQLPRVPGTIPLFLKHVWAFDKIKITEEDRGRTQMYRAEQKRKDFREKSSTLPDFLADLQLKVSMNRMRPSQLERVSQLTLRTNQFNLSTLRRKEGEISKLVENPGTCCWVIEVSDRFGEYGLVGVVITEEKEESLFIDTLLLSCRVLGRGVEEVILAGLRKYSREQRFKFLEANYYPNARNKPILEFLQKKWIKQNEGGEYITFIYPLERRSESVEFVDFYYMDSYKKEIPAETTETETVLLDHIGIAVADMGQAVSLYRSLGFTCGEEVYDPLQKSHLVMCRKPGWGSIELIAAAGSDSPTRQLVNKNGDTPYHLCYCVKDIEAFCLSLDQQEIRYEIVSDSKPAVLFDNKKVIFLQIEQVGVVEFLEDRVRDYNIKNRREINNNIVRVVVNRPEASLHFYRHLGYVPVKHTNHAARLVILLEKAGSGRIELVVPKDESLDEWAFLSHNGAHVYQICFDRDSMGEVAAGIGKKETAYICFRKSAAHDSSPLHPSWEIETGLINREELVHQRQLLPLENHTAKKLLGLPTYEVDDQLAAEAGYKEPRNQRERGLVEIWQKTLKVEKIGIDANFFQMGGNSLKAIRLISEIHKVFNVELSLRDIFENKTVRQLAHLVDNAEEDVYSSINVVEDKVCYPLSSAQKRLYFLQQMEPMSTGYNMSNAVKLEENVDRGRLEDAFRKLIERHESLRTSFRVVNQELVQVIHEEADFEIEYYSARESAANIIKNFIRPFDLSRAPLLRVGFTTAEDSRQVLMVDMHHIVCDGVSHEILVRDFMTCYDGGVLRRLRIQYKDFADWQNREKERESLEKQRRYWLGEFEGEIPVLNLPTDFLRPTTRRFDGSREKFEIPVDINRILKASALEGNVTMYMIYLAVFNMLLSKLSGQEDVVIGTPAAGRRHSDLEGIIGMFVNTLALRNFPKGEKTFREFLVEVRERTLAGFENQDYQFEELVEEVGVKRDTSRHPLFDVMFVFQDFAAEEPVSPRLKISPYQYERHTARFDLAFEGRLLSDQLFFTLEYSTKLFKQETILRFIGYLREIISVIPGNFDKKLSELEIISEEEKTQILVDFNDTESDYPEDKRIHQLFEEQVEKRPDHIAVVGSTLSVRPGNFPMTGNRFPVSLSYRELRTKSNRLARLLKEEGMSPESETLAAIMVERSVEMIIGILAVLKAGAAYLPIDPVIPTERIEYMLQDSSAKLMITTRTFAEEVEKLRSLEVETIYIEDIGRRQDAAGSRERQRRGEPCVRPSMYSPESRDAEEVEKYRRLGKDTHGRVSKEPATCNLQPVTISSNLCYVIYTSGSTGRPKGVAVHHHGIVNLVCRHKEIFFLDQEERLSQVASQSFDAMSFELWPSLLSPSALHIADNNTRMDPLRLKEWLIRHRVTISFQPTVMVMQLLEEDWPETGVALKSLLAAGDLLTLYPSRSYPFQLYNLYGPTEDSVWTTWTPVAVKSPEEPDSGEVSRDTLYPPIGRPIGNHQVYIMDSNLNLQPVGLAGELGISGIGLARGYLNQPELTAEKFISTKRIAQSAKRKERSIDQKVPGAVHAAPLGANLVFARDPHHSSLITHHSDLLYKTGDLARWLADGNIEFLGRNDQQVKIRGFRIESGEIENQLLTYDKVKEACVLVREENSGKYLCAYVVSEEEIDKLELQNFLSKRLPDYMVPPCFIQLDKLPLTTNGKIDRRALPIPVLESEVQYSAPRNKIEEKLQKIWEKVLGRNKIGINDNFFTLGGDSIKTIQIASRLSRIGYKVEMRDIFQYPTISQLVPLIKKLEREADQKVVTGVVPLTPIQRNFFQTNTTERRHFNQAVMLYAGEGFDEEAVRAIFHKLQTHHDALRMTFQAEAGEIVQVNRGLELPLDLLVFDYRQRNDAAALVEKKANQIQASIDLNAGPLMKLGLFHMDDGDRLLIVIHHLVIDGVSWRLLFEDISRLHRQFKKGEPLQLPKKTDSFKTWASKLSQYADSQSFLKEKTYWVEVESNRPEPIMKDFAVENNCEKDTHKLYFSLDERETQLLLTTVNEPFGTEVKDILLTALGLGIKQSFGSEKILVAVEGHGREEILKDVDITRTVGWFTTVYPVFLDLSYEHHGKNLSRQIKEIKECLHRVPNKGIGYGLLKYLTADKYKGGFKARQKPQIIFNYLGQFAADLRQMSFEIAKESSGKKVSKNIKREFELDVTGIVDERQLVISLTYNRRQFKKETMQALLNHYKNALRSIVSYCSTISERELTPSDFSFRDLSIDRAEDLQKEYPIQDICTLTPLQEGMLFHFLYEENSTVYFLQTCYRFLGELDISLVQRSLNELVMRHEALRTVFVYQGIERPIQVILKKREMDFHLIDLSTIAEPEKKEEFVRDIREKDRQSHFDFRRGNPTRVKVIQLEPRCFELIWSHHHIVMDGWCSGILMTEFLEIYSSFLEKRAYQLPEITPYRTYIQWLEKQSKEHSKEYWKQRLEGYEVTAIIPGRKSRENRWQEVKIEEFFTRLGKELNMGLVQLSSRCQVTLNTIFNTLWAILLGKYNDRQDVVFGTVVSGRPSEIPGVESMVGLFINTIPVRISYQDNTSFIQLLGQVQKLALDSEPHHFYPLAKIQSQTVLKQDLFDHLLVFENYPHAEQIEGIRDKVNKNNHLLRMELINIETFEQTHYGFILVVGGNPIDIKIQFNANVYDREWVVTIADHLNAVIEQVLANEHIMIKDIALQYDLLEAKTEDSETDYVDFDV